MPKMKTNKAAQKRFKITGTGKVLKEKANDQHKFEYKSSRRKRRLARLNELTGGDREKALRLLRLK